MVGVAVARSLGRRGARRSPLRFALTLVLGALFSPHLNPHDGLILVPAAAIAYGALRVPAGRRLDRRSPCSQSPFVVLLTNPLSVTEPGGPIIRTPVVLVAAFAVTLAVALRTAPNASPA